MVCVLLSTYNGEKYISDLIESLLNQTYKDFRIIIRDDGSTDRTLEILHSYDLDVISSKENVGVTKSFSILLEYAINHSEYKYFMFCDQDDVWKSNKIMCSLSKVIEMEKLYKHQPILVHTDLMVVDENMNLINDSFYSYQGMNVNKNSFHDMILNNVVAGCTAIINRSLAQLCLPIPEHCIEHDWWIALVASKFGKIGYLNDSTIKYRQHANNTVGARKQNAKYIYHSMIRKISLTKYVEQSKTFLGLYRKRLNKEDISFLEEFISIQKKSFLEKRIILIKYKLHKHGLIKNIGFFFKV